MCHQSVPLGGERPIDVWHQGTRYNTREVVSYRSLVSAAVPPRWPETLANRVVTRNVDMDTSHIVKQLSGWNYTGHVFGMFAFWHWRVPCWYFCCQLLFYDCPGSRLPKPSIYPDISAVSPTYLPRRWLTVYKSVTHLSFRNLTSRFSNGRSSPAEKENKIFIWRQSTQVHTWEPHAGHRGGFSSSKIMPPLVLICESRQPGFHLFISCKRSLRIFFPEVGRGGCRGSGFCPCRGSASFMDKFVALKFLCYLLPSAATTWLMCVSTDTYSLLTCTLIEFR